MTASRLRLCPAATDCLHRRAPWAQRIQLGGLLLIAIVAVGSCVSSSSHGPRRLARAPRAAVATPGTPGSATETPTVDDNVPAPPPLNVTARDTAVSFVVDDAAGGAPLSVSLGARITKAEGVHGPGVVVVPGGGDVSRDGRRQGDGVSTYPAAVDVARAWAEAFAGRGAVVLTYDKRTCGHNDDPQCTTNPQADVDAQGPVALARDVDAACALLRRDSDFDGRLVLLAHGQAGQVALASTCAASASAVVLLSPIPRSIDDVLVDAIAARAKAADDAARQTRNPDDKRARQAEAARLKNLGASRAASFSSMKSAKFSPTARVDGATIAFWLGWMKLTADTTSLASSVKERLVVVVGGRDRQLSPGDKTAAAALPAHRFLVVDDADHHLLVDGALSDAVTEPVFAAVDEILGTPGS